jgi:outer membrane protein assembly factor BamB
MRLKQRSVRWTTTAIRLLLRSRSSRTLQLTCGLIFLINGSLPAADWPMYLHDGARSGITSEKLPTPLVEGWSFKPLGSPQPAWGDPKPEAVEGYLELRRIHFDDCFQPVAVGDAVYFGSSVDNKVYCLDAATGQIRWTTITGGPIRLAPTVSEGKVYVGSDDGCGYCLDAADGSVVWKFRAAPEDQRVLGNGRMISLWPIRSSVLVDDGVAYLTAGIFPAEGVFLFALDAATGKEIWRNDTCGEASQSRVSPQGYLLASETTLYAPMGRVSPAAFDRGTGTLKYLTNFGKAVGGTYALLVGDDVYTGTETMVGYHGQNRADRFATFVGQKIVVTDDVAYVATGTDLSALDRVKFPVAASKIESLKARKTTLQREMRAGPTDEQKARMAELDKQLKLAQAEFAAATRWKVPSTCADSLILAGDVLVAGGSGELQALAAASGEKLATVKVEGAVKGLAVASGRLLVSTDSGVIYSLGAKGSPQHGRVAAKAEPNPFSDTDAGKSAKFQEAAAKIIQDTGINRGYGLVIGLESGQLAVELAKRSEMMIYAVDSDPDKVAAVRGKVDAAGLYGTRVCVECWPYDEIPYSDYFANLIVSETLIAGGMLSLKADSVLRMLKPLDGTAVTRLHANTPNAADGVRQWAAESGIGECLSVDVNGEWAKIVRGAVPGAGSWTHLYANSSNTACGDDTAVKTPLGVLWFGSPGPGEMVQRHERAAGPLSIDGRMFIQGENVLMAYDIYNGVELWKRDVAGAKRANAAHDGSNLALNSDGFFVAIGDHCLRIDPASGKTLATYKFPEADDNASRRWIYTALGGKLLYGSRSAGRLTSDRVFAVEIDGGKHRWVYDGKRIASNAMAIGKGMLFLIDTNVTPEQRGQAVEAQRGRIGLLPEAERAAALKDLENADIRTVVALDAESGEVRWRKPIDLTHCGGGTLSVVYNEGVLVIFGVYIDGHYWREFFAGQFDSRRVTVLSADDGSFVWSKPVGYRVRPIVIGNTLHTEPWAFDLHTGEPRTRVHPVTGKTERWQFARSGHHCGLPIASPNCLFFRSHNFGYYDLLKDDGTMHFGAHRPGCWINFIPAGGLLLMPEASAGCMCPFPVMCSVVFKPTDKNKAYTQYSAVGDITPVKRLAVNLGAAGDRSDAGGKLWLAYPRPFKGRLVMPLDAKVTFHPGGKYVKRSSSYTPIAGTEDPWLFTSSATGLKTCEIPLLEPADGTALYSVRLAFADPVNSRPGQRVFNVKLQGKVVLENLDIAKETGGADRAIFKQFDGVEVTQNLLIELVSKAKDSAPEKAPILQAVEVVQQRVTSIGCAVPGILLNDAQSEKPIEVKLVNIRDTAFTGTLQVSVPDGFEVSPRHTEIKLAAGDRISMPLTVAVKPGVDAGEYRITVSVLKGDGSLEIQRSATIEHLGPHGRITVPVTEDTVVHARYPDRNWGTTRVMMVDGGNAKMGDEHHTLAYLKFQLDLPGKLTSTRLRIHNAGNPSSDSGHVCLTAEPWSETQLTYASRPAVGEELAKLGKVFTDQIVECPLKVDLTGKKELSVVIEPTSCDGVDYLTREAGRPAELIIEYLLDQ